MSRRARAAARWLLLAIGCVSWVSRVGCKPQTEPPAPPPNVVLLVVDTLRADHVHDYGYPRETTPAIDAIAQGGVRFDAAIAPSSWSAPSHTTIVTGTDPSRHRVMGWSQEIPSAVKPLAAILAEAGYETGLFSSHYAVHVGVAGITAGFGEQFIARNDDDAEVVRRAERWVRSAASPWFLYVCLMTPHAPYTKYPPAWDSEYFTDLPPGGEAVFPFTSEVWVGEAGIPLSVRLGDQDQLGFYVNRYDRSIRYADSLVGRLWSALRDAGSLEDTIVAVTSDHGEALGERGAFAHELYLYDFLVRVPLVLHYPRRVAPGRPWTSQVSLADIVPTVLGLAGLEGPANLDGLDLSRELVAGTRPNPTRLLTGTYRYRGYDRYMVRSDRFKLIYDAVLEREELYDLVSDPAEAVDLLAGERRPAEHGRLRAELDALIARHRAIDPERVDHPPDAELIDKLRALGYLRAESQ